MRSHSLCLPIHALSGLTSLTLPLLVHVKLFAAFGLANLFSFFCTRFQRCLYLFAIIVVSGLGRTSGARTVPMLRCRSANLPKLVEWCCASAMKFGMWGARCCACRVKNLVRRCGATKYNTAPGHGLMLEEGIENRPGAWPKMWAECGAMSN